MKVFVAGASGALGVPLVRRLQDAGHEVLGLAHSSSGRDRLRAIDVRPIVADALDRESLLRAVEGESADVVVHELTALAKSPTSYARMEPTNRLRTTGTTNLLAAAKALGARRFVVQSFLMGYGYRDHGTTPLTEDAPFAEPQGGKLDPIIEAMRSAEEQTFRAYDVDGIEGIALRYGMLYGGDALQYKAMLDKRAVPVANGGALSWVHHEDAAAATVAAVERGRNGQAYNIADNEAASWRDLVLAYAAAVGAPRPLSLPGWLLKLVAPYVARIVADSTIVLSTTKAADELGWRPAYPTYRDGMQAVREAVTAASSRG